MKFLFNISARRNTVCMVLLVWLFALISGVVNACLLETRETHSHVVAAESFETAQTLVIVPGHAGAVADRNSVGESHPKAPCLKVCDDSSRSFPNQILTLAHAGPSPELFVMVLWSTTAPVVITLNQIDDEQPATPGLPIRVRFSRLTI